MNEHILMKEMERFCARALDIPETARIAEHLSCCAPCREIYDQVFDRRRNHAPVAVSLSNDWLKNEHLEYEQIVPYVENRLEEADREMADIHLRMCDRCREDVRDFREYRREIEPQLTVQDTPTLLPSLRSRIFDRLNTAQAGWRPIYAAVICLIMIALIAFSAVFVNRTGKGNKEVRETQAMRSGSVPQPLPVDGVEQEAQEARNKTTARNTVEEVKSPGSNGRQTFPAPPRGRHPRGKVTRERSNAAGELTLNDGPRRIAFSEAGAITGIEDIPPQLHQVIREALLTRDIKRPEELADIAGAVGALRGSSRGDGSFKLLSPGRVVIAEDRPTFRWQGLPGTTSYQVQVVDSSNREAAKSPKLTAPATEWTPPMPLKRGIVYTWVVTATLNGEEITAPGVSEAEMRFKTLDIEEADVLSHLKGSNSHLALGIFYAQVGMVREAEQEFQALVGENPRSLLALTLLRRVQSWR